MIREPDDIDLVINSNLSEEDFRKISEYIKAEKERMAREKEKIQEAEKSLI